MITKKNTQKLLVKRIESLCKKKGYTMYQLAYESAVPLNTLMHILNGRTQNPGMFTVIKICDGLKISLKDFFDAEEFSSLISESDT